MADAAARCPSRSLTVVGDRAQARHGFTESWTERLERVGLDRITLATLSINYRTPEEVMAEAEPVIRAALPDANVPTSVRSTGVPVRHGSASELDEIVDDWIAAHDEGIACVIGDPAVPRVVRASCRSRRRRPRGSSSTSSSSSSRDSLGTGIEGAVDHYVAMTRATQQLVVLSAD